MEDPYAETIIREQATREPVTVIRLQDAVYGAPIPGVETLYLQEDAEARGIVPLGKALDYDELLRRILESDRVVSW